MSLYDTASAKVQTKRATLAASVAEKEGALRAAMAKEGVNGGTFVLAVVLYEAALRELADFCAEQYIWVGQNAVLPGWRGRWGREADLEVHQLFLVCLNRLQQFVVTTQLNSVQMQKISNGRLRVAYVSVITDMKHRFQVTTEESRSAIKKKALSHIQKALWAAGGSAATMVWNFVRVHYHL